MGPSLRGHIKRAKMRLLLVGSRYRRSCALAERRTMAGWVRDSGNRFVALAPDLSARDRDRAGENGSAEDDKRMQPVRARRSGWLGALDHMGTRVWRRTMLSGVRESCNRPRTVQPPMNRSIQHPTILPHRQKCRVAMARVTMMLNSARSPCPRRLVGHSTTFSGSKRRSKFLFRHGLAGAQYQRQAWLWSGRSGRRSRDSFGMSGAMWLLVA